MGGERPDPRGGDDPLTPGESGRPRNQRAGFRLLYVCTGNICRSAFAEILTRHLLVERLGALPAAAFVVSSAGVAAAVGSQVHPYTRAELAPWGLDGVIADRFIARQLNSALVAEADLVLGANPRHRSTIAARTPSALPKAFSLREFARLVAAVEGSDLPAEPVQRAHALVEQARRRRGVVLPSPDGDCLPDPMGGPPKAHHEAGMLIQAAVATIIDVIAPSRS